MKKNLRRFQDPLVRLGFSQSGTWHNKPGFGSKSTKSVRNTPTYKNQVHSGGPNLKRGRHRYSTISTTKAHYFEHRISSWKRLAMHTGKVDKASTALQQSRYPQESTSSPPSRHPVIATRTPILDGVLRCATASHHLPTRPNPAHMVTLHTTRHIYKDDRQAAP